MAWASRIQTERQRHVIIAIVMAVLLIAAVAAAGWVTAQRRVAEPAEPQPPTAELDRIEAWLARDPAEPLEPEQVATFRLARPAAWEAVEPALETESPLRELARWQESDGRGRRLALLEWLHDDPLPPSAAMDWILTQGDQPAPGLTAYAAIDSRTMRGLIAQRRGMQVDAHTPNDAEPAANAEPISQLLAVMTLDGRRHAGLVLERRGEIEPDDLRLIVHIASSLTDADYSRIDSTLVALDDRVTVTVPDGLTALRRHGTPPTPDQPHQRDKPGDKTTGKAANALNAAEPPCRLLLIPTGGSAFFLLEPRAVHAAPEPQNGDEAPPARIALGRRYAELVGQQPPPHSIRPVDVGEQHAYAIDLPAAHPASRSSLWAVPLNARRVMLVRLTSAADDVHAAQRAAQRFAQENQG